MMVKRIILLSVTIVILSTGCAEKLEKYTETYDKVKYDLTFTDLKQIVSAFEGFKESYGHLPEISQITDLKNYQTDGLTFIPYFLKTSVSLRDSWGKYFLFKIDPANPSNYWLASSGGDKVFGGFDQIINVDPKKNSDDIIYYNGKLIYSPLSRIPKKK